MEPAVVNHADIAGVILAGGQGRRMGMIDKGLQPFSGETLVRRVLRRLAPQVATVLISANRNLDRYRELGCPVVTDRIPGFAGPLAGLQAAFFASDVPLIVTVPCDSPFLPEDLVQRLRAGLEAKDADIAVPRTGTQVHRAFGLMRREIQPGLEAFLDSGERRVGLWQASLNVAEVEFDDQPDAFSNINTPEELMRLAPHGKNA